MIDLFVCQVRAVESDAIKRTRSDTGFERSFTKGRDVPFVDAIRTAGPAPAIEVASH